MLFWNIYGVGNSESFCHLKFLVKCFDVKILVIVEPKISGDSAARVCRNLDFDGAFRQEAVGRSGGIWVLRTTSHFNFTIIQHNSCFVHGKVCQVDGFSWYLTAVYKNPNGKEGS